MYKVARINAKEDLFFIIHRITKKKKREPR